MSVPAIPSFKTPHLRKSSKRGDSSEKVETKSEKTETKPERPASALTNRSTSTSQASWKSTSRDYDPWKDSGVAKSWNQDSWGNDYPDAKAMENCFTPVTGELLMWLLTISFILIIFVTSLETILMYSIYSFCFRFLTASNIVWHEQFT